MTYCHKNGHIANDCWYKEENKPIEAGLMHDNRSEEETLLLMYQCETTNGGVWYLGSGASKHMTGDRMMFTKLIESDLGQVRVGDGKAYEIKGVGEVEFKMKIGRNEKISEVYYVPDLKNNLLNVAIF